MSITDKNKMWRTYQYGETIFTPTFISNRRRKVSGGCMIEIENVDEQIGEVLGLEIAAQKVVEELFLQKVSAR